MRIVEARHHVSLEHYAALSYLSAAVERLRQSAAAVAPRFFGRRIWMLNSTAEGGGVAELLPAHISILRQLGFDVRWLVMETEDRDFFPLTKRLHNLLHAADEALPGATERALYERVARAEADVLQSMLAPRDVLIVHDPQPLATGAFLEQHLDVQLIWRCHIGVDTETAGTRAAWEFLKPYTASYDEAVFSLSDYIPAFLQKKARVIHPSIDPLSHKNRDLSLHKLVGILADADLVTPQWPLLAPPFEHRARRVMPDRSMGEPAQVSDIGLLGRPIVTQISRWDLLKGFEPLLHGFVRMKQELRDQARGGTRHRNRLDAVRLVLAGPDPLGVQDDPEAAEVFARMSELYATLPPALQADVAILALPMSSVKDNALMVNGLQRASDIIVQNSLREGFGLTVAEAMWKSKALLGSGAAAGVRLQVRDRIDGRLVDPNDVDAIAFTLSEMLSDSDRLEEYGRNAHGHVFGEFLIFSEIEQWLQMLQQADAVVQ